MGNLDAALKRYYRSISQELPCSRKLKKQILRQIVANVNIFLEQNPHADLEMVQAHFGTAHEIAAGYIDNEDTPMLLDKMRIKEKVLAVIAGTMALILLIWAAATAWAIIDETYTKGGYIVVDIEED